MISHRDLVLKAWVATTIIRAALPPFPAKKTG